MKVFTCVKIAHTQCVARSNEQTMRKLKTTTSVDVEQLMADRLGAINNRFISKL